MTQAWGITHRPSTSSCLPWLQGEVPDYLIGYFDYITSLGPLDIPDYEWCMMQLDSGATGVAPARSPIRRQLADWPSRGEVYSRKDYALVSMHVAGRTATSIVVAAAGDLSTAGAAQPRGATAPSCRLPTVQRTH